MTAYGLSIEVIDQLTSNMRKAKFVRYRNHKELFLQHLERIVETHDNWHSTMTRTRAAMDRLRIDLMMNPTKLRCHTTNPELIKEEARIDHTQLLTGAATQYYRTFPNMTNYDQMKNVCFDSKTPTLFHITERIRIYDEVLRGNLPNLMRDYRNEFGQFPAYPYSKDYRCQRTFPDGYKPPSVDALPPQGNVGKTRNGRISRMDPRAQNKEPSHELLLANSYNERPEHTTSWGLERGYL